MFRHFLSGPEYVLLGDSFQEDIPGMRSTRRYAYGRLRGTLCAELTEGGSPDPSRGSSWNMKTRRFRTARRKEKRPPHPEVRRPLLE